MEYSKFRSWGAADSIGDQLTVVTTSPKYLELKGSYNYFCYTKSWTAKYQGVYKRDKSRERVEYMAQLKNNAIDEALSEFGNTEYIVVIEAYYVSQPGLRRLIEDYFQHGYWRDSILGASTWFYDRSRIVRRTAFYDGWSCPEYRDYQSLRPPSLIAGIVRVSSVGSCIIFPRNVWTKGTRFEVPHDFPEGCHYNHFCRASGMPVYLDMNAKLWQTSKNNPDIPDNRPWKKRLQTSLGVRKRMKRYMSTHSSSS